MAYTGQTSYAKAVLTKLRSKLVVAKTFNTKYDDQGETIKIAVLDTEVAVGDYNKEQGKSITQGSNTYKTIIKDIDIAVNEMIDGKTRSEVSFDMVVDRLDSAGYSLGLTWERKAIKKLEDVSNAVEITEPTKETIYAEILAGQEALDNLNVEREGRILAVKHSIIHLIKRSPEFIKSGDLSQEMLLKGQVGMIDGLPILASNNFQNAATRFTIYNPTFCHSAMGFKVDPRIEDLTNEFVGSSAVKGRVSGALHISREEAVYTAKVNSAN